MGIKHNVKDGVIPVDSAHKMYSLCVIMLRTGDHHNGGKNGEKRGEVATQCREQTFVDCVGICNSKEGLLGKHGLSSLHSHLC